MRSRPAIATGLALIAGFPAPVLVTMPVMSQPVASPAAEAPPVFQPGERAVSTWRTEAARSLVLDAGQAAALRNANAAAPPVARCVKLNNYWCIKKAGWNGEIAADGEGHVAFASASEGAAVAALLLKRYYVDFHRRTALAIVSHWAPAGCGGGSGRVAGGPLGTLTGIAGTLRARWLAGHSRAAVPSPAPARRSKVADRVPRFAGPPPIAVGFGAGSRAGRPITLDALLASTPGLPPSRSMIGLGGVRGKPAGVKPASSKPASSKPASMAAGASDPVEGCAGDNGRIAAYATRAAAGIPTGPDGDLGLFAADGTPTGNLRTAMANMALVEIGPLGASPELIEAGIAEAFRPDRNVSRR